MTADDFGPDISDIEALYAELAAIADFRDLPWADKAACSDPGIPTDIFYTERGVSSKAAKAVCDGCSYRNACLEWAMERKEQHGVWGGLTHRERRSLRRERKAEIAARNRPKT